MLNFESLKKINNGGSRELYIKKEKAKAVVKTQVLKKDYFNEHDPENFDASKLEYIDYLKQIQNTAKSIFGDLYIPSRFYNVIKKGNDLVLVTHETFLPNIYPSDAEGHEHIINICGVGYQNLDNTISASDGEKIFNLVTGNIQDISTDSFVKMHPDVFNQWLQTSSDNYTNISFYLDKIREYHNIGFRLDLVGKDNVVIDSSNSQIIINSSAIKGELFDTFDTNLKNVVSSNSDTHLSNNLMNQLAERMNYNVFAKLVGKPSLTILDEESNNNLHELLTKLIPNSEIKL